MNLLAFQINSIICHDLTSISTTDVLVLMGESERTDNPVEEIGFNLCFLTFCSFFFFFSFFFLFFLVFCFVFTASNYPPLSLLVSSNFSYTGNMFNYCPLIKFQFCSARTKGSNSKLSATYNKGNNKITELRTILQRESQNS